jgi:hypothetical protein
VSFAILLPRVYKLVVVEYIMLFTSFQIHLGIHVHLVADDKCKKSFKEMKNMVANEVCCTPNATTLAIILFVSKIFLSRIQDVH